jgi:HEAT repeat protein
MKLFASFLIAVLSLFSVFALPLSRQDEADNVIYARQLASRDAATRQSAAEELARRVALDQKKIVEGYLLQEKDKRVRLALNWALYRMGKSDLLFQIVRDLDSSRQDQAVGYLSQLERADSLYVFLRQESTKPKIIRALIEAIGRIGDTAALQEIKPFLDSYDPDIAETAKNATNLLTTGVAATDSTVKTRPRTTATPEKP